MASNTAPQISTQVQPSPDDTPPAPFGGAGALRPAQFTNTNVVGRAANDNHLASRIRRDFDERLGFLGRWVVDRFTGNPIADGKSRPIKLGPISYLALNTAIGFSAAAVTAATVTYVPLIAPLVVPWTMLIQTGRMRKNQTHLGHEASHGNFFLRGDKRRDWHDPVFLGLGLNDFLGELATTLSLSKNMEVYRRDHDLHHDRRTYTTVDDPDTAYVRTLGNLPRALLDPRAYARDFAARIASNILAMRYVGHDETTDKPGREISYWPRRLMGLVWISFLIGLAFVMPFPAWLLAVFVPYAILFRISGVLQILSLHDWDLPPATSWQEYADRTWARFSGIPLPERGLKGAASIKAWTRWGAEMLFLELPFRLGVLSSDLQTHDVHHLEWVLAFDLKLLPEFVDDWRNQPLRRAEVIRDTKDALGMSKREIWGVRAMWRAARTNLQRLRDRKSTASVAHGANDETDGVVAFDDHIAIRCDKD